MQIPLVMTIISPDRTGLVEAVARAVADHGGNWLESRMCRLGGDFAGILRIEIPAEKKSPPTCWWMFRSRNWPALKFHAGNFSSSIAPFLIYPVRDV